MYQNASCQSQRATRHDSGRFVLDEARLRCSVDLLMRSGRQQTWADRTIQAMSYDHIGVSLIYRRNSAAAPASFAAPPVEIGSSNESSGDAIGSGDGGGDGGGGGGEGDEGGSGEEGGDDGDGEPPIFPGTAPDNGGPDNFFLLLLLILYVCLDATFRFVLSAPIRTANWLYSHTPDLRRVWLSLPCVFPDRVRNELLRPHIRTMFRDLIRARRKRLSVRLWVGFWLRVRTVLLVLRGVVETAAEHGIRREDVIG